ncbi:hypothetical protein [Emergencia timonensis]|uniref:hypothetical protein n=1 Tax=Emergencia timonensis TaxID=1776384 RepID=UPI0039957C9E
MAQNSARNHVSAFIFDFYGFTGTTPFADSWFLIQNLLYSTVNYNFFLKSALKKGKPLRNYANSAPARKQEVEI